MIRHVVMLKFKKDADPAKIDLFIEEVKKLSHLNREVRDYSENGGGIVGHGSGGIGPLRAA
ncbi:hypothetical protein ACFSLT_17515 [Novosphingobium resinovorum]|uniref:hypothetical protein n=1 Tax=Novosphingobium resinovorum TaxID=158500 RepID=UPI00361181D9